MPVEHCGESEQQAQRKYECANMSAQQSRNRNDFVNASAF